MRDLILAIDQGTTSSRAVVFDLEGREVATATEQLPVVYPKPGWVEQEPEQIWTSQSRAVESVIRKVGPDRISSIGITNQRETVLAWDRISGESLTPAIVWQCRRSAPLMDELRGTPEETLITTRTGLVLDAYFSASKIHWLIQHTPGLSQKVDSGDAVFGTIDAFLAFKFSKGRSLLTEPSNASRTMLFDIQRGGWDPELCKLFGISPEALPPVRDSFGELGTFEIQGHSFPLTAVLGDQQASLFGHGAFSNDRAKCTFGTGAFLLRNTGSEIVRSKSGLLSTVAWKPPGAELCYAIEGSVFVAGSIVQWLRDSLNIIKDSSEIEVLAAQVSSVGDVVFVPALTGLGSPHWDQDARGLILGLTRDSSAAHIARAALEGVAHLTADLLDTPEFSDLSVFAIDGGMARSELFCRILRSTTGRKIYRAPHTETTAFGVALAAGLGAGILSLDKIQDIIGSNMKEFSEGEPTLPRERWSEALVRSRDWAK